MTHAERLTVRKSYFSRGNGERWRKIREARCHAVGPSALHAAVWKARKVMGQ